MTAVAAFAAPSTGAAITNDDIRRALRPGGGAGSPGGWLHTFDNPSREELAELLERNGFPGAASDIANGADIKTATSYIARRQPRYDDGECRWLHEYIDDLHSIPSDERGSIADPDDEQME